MTDTIDAVLGATTGLMAVGVMTNVANKMIKPVKMKPIKHSLKLKGGKKW